ncbi:hypothetical protein MKW94_004721 [Papaver nudicaule]|uniref:Uncharacterized protein n=1 Tax=Papaver nudicaule TaxID=74823 RepID=A0AA41RXB0_PAPNU|nr:hypothetical protein [Papaver nudicaule]
MISNVVVSLEDDTSCLKGIQAAFSQLSQVLDLSDNKISGTIPSQICTWLPYLTTLDLSGNELTGHIPINLVNCTYLNTLRLSNNHLSGKIPDELSRLLRLTDFTVANNDLSGRIPFNSSSFSPGPPGAFDGYKRLYYGKCHTLNAPCTFSLRNDPAHSSSLTKMVNSLCSAL